MNELNPAFFIPLFFLGFLAFWLFVMAILAALGWRKFSERHASDILPVDATIYRWRSLNIGSGLVPINYSNCINAWHTEQGFYLRPILPFRVFHPLLHFSWGDIQSIAPKKILLMRRYEITLKRYKIIFKRDLPMITLQGGLGEVVYQQ